MAKTKPESVAEKRGLALVDLPSHNLKSGEFATLPNAVADALAANGQFDTKAKETK